MYILPIFLGSKWTTFFALTKQTGGTLMYFYYICQIISKLTFFAYLQMKPLELVEPNGPLGD